MRQYWIRLTFSDTGRKAFPRPVITIDEQSTIEAARLGRVAERVVMRPNDEAARNSAKGWLRLHRRAAGNGPKFDRWLVIGTNPSTNLPYAVSSGGPDDD